MISSLALDVTLPDSSAWGAVELLILVDGNDILSPVFDRGPRGDPDRLLGPDSPLIATEQPHEVRLAEAACTECCCGAIYTRIRRDGDDVVWDHWRNPHAERVDLDMLRFDAEQYHAELTRGDADRSWEWRGWTAARLLRRALNLEPDVMQLWNSSLDFVACGPRERDIVEVVFTSPPRQVLVEFARLFDRSMEHKQYRLRIPVADNAATEQAAQAVATLRDSDPRNSAEICGGNGVRPWPRERDP